MYLKTAELQSIPCEQHELCIVSGVLFLTHRSMVNGSIAELTEGLFALMPSLQLL